MVTILSDGLTSPKRIEHERTISPLMCTEQAPHCATPQPYLVPVRPTCSRMTQSSGVSASTCTSRTRPLMLSFVIEPSRRDPNRFCGSSRRMRPRSPWTRVPRGLGGLRGPPDRHEVLDGFLVHRAPVRQGVLS